MTREELHISLSMILEKLRWALSDIKEVIDEVDDPNVRRTLDAAKNATGAAIAWVDCSHVGIGYCEVGNRKDGE